MKKKWIPYKVSKWCWFRGCRMGLKLMLSQKQDTVLGKLGTRGKWSTLEFFGCSHHKRQISNPPRPLPPMFKTAKCHPPPQRRYQRNLWLWRLWLLALMDIVRRWRFWNLAFVGAARKFQMEGTVSIQSFECLLLEWFLQSVQMYHGIGIVPKLP